jgi:hypothetical protein
LPGPWVRVATPTQLNEPGSRSYVISEYWFDPCAGVTSRAWAFSQTAKAPLLTWRSAQAPGESHLPPSDSGLSVPVNVLGVADELATEKPIDLLPDFGPLRMRGSGQVPG